MSSVQTCCHCVTGYELVSVLPIHDTLPKKTQIPIEGDFMQDRKITVRAKIVPSTHLLSLVYKLKIYREARSESGMKSAETGVWQCISHLYM